MLLAAGTAAATLAGIVPVLSSRPAAAGPMRVDTAGVTVSVQAVHAASSDAATVVVPEGVTSLTGAASGSPALAARARLTVTRSTDGATLFVGSLATFRSLPVVSGASLVVRVQKPIGFTGLRAGALLRWS